MISIQMINICDTSICRPLKLIFQCCLEKGKLPNEWKQANEVPVHKKVDKQIFKYYRPISLFSIAGKILKDYCMTGCLNFSQQIIRYLNISQVSDQVILALINFSLSLMKFINPSMIILKSDLHFQIYLKHLIRFSAKVLYSN